MTKRLRRVLSTVALLAMLMTLMIPMHVSAASLTVLSDTMSRMKVSTASNHTIRFTTATAVHPGDTVTLTFPAGFTIGAVDYTDIDVADDGTDLGLALTPGTGPGSALGAAFSGQLLTITENDSDTIAAGSVITIEIGTNATFGVAGARQITNPGVANSYAVNIAGTFGDTGAFAVAIATEDQVNVTATVDPTLTFALTDAAANLGTLTTGAVNVDTAAFTVTTNATAGYVVTITEDGNLRTVNPPGNDINDCIDGVVTAGSEEYGVSTSKAGQTITQTAGNNASQLDATAKSCASFNAPIVADATTLTFHASISPLTPAGQYAQVCTLIATGTF